MWLAWMRECEHYLQGAQSRPWFLHILNKQTYAQTNTEPGEARCGPFRPFFRIRGVYGWLRSCGSLTLWCCCLHSGLKELSGVPVLPKFFPKELGAASNASELKSKRRGLLCRFFGDRVWPRRTEEKAGFSGVPPAFDTQRLLGLSSLSWINNFPTFASRIFKENNFLFAALVFHWHQYTEAKTSVSSFKVGFMFLPIWSLIESLILPLDESVELML